MLFSSCFHQFCVLPETVVIADVSTPAIMKLNQVFLCCVDEICFDSAYRYFPVPVLLSTYHGGRVAESEWGPIRGGATQSWFEECSKKTEKLQIWLFIGFVMNDIKHHAELSSQYSHTMPLQGTSIRMISIILRCPYTFIT